MLIVWGKGLETNDIAHRLVQRLKLRHLALLIEIERLGSLTKVADLMAMSQPAVTQALAEVEQNRPGGVGGFHALVVGDAHRAVRATGPAAARRAARCAPTRRCATI